MLEQMHHAAALQHRPILHPHPPGAIQHTTSKTVCRSSKHSMHGRQAPCCWGPNPKHYLGSCLQLQLTPAAPASSWRHQHKLGGFTTRAYARSQEQSRPITLPVLQPWQVVVGTCAIAMLLCNLHRAVFTSLVPGITQHHSLSMVEVGVVQSAMLWGYLAGQLPAGWLSDKLGGERVMLVCLLLWSAALCASGLVQSLPGLLLSRAAMGLFSACAMPAVSAIGAAWVPANIKATTIAAIYMMFNIGGVLGMAATPSIAALIRWQDVLVLSGLAGVVWSVMGWVLLPAQAHSRAISIPSKVSSTRSRDHLTNGASVLSIKSSVSPEHLGHGLSFQAGTTLQDAAQVLPAPASSVTSTGTPNLTSSRTGIIEPGDATQGLAYAGSTAPAREQRSHTLNDKLIGPRRSAQIAPNYLLDNQHHRDHHAASSTVGTYATARYQPAPAWQGTSTALLEPPSEDAMLPFSQGVPPWTVSAADHPQSRSSPRLAAAAASQHQQGVPSHTHKASAPGRAVRQVLALCWAHAVIGWSFFIMSSWVPLYLQSLSSQAVQVSSLLSSAPFLAAALVGAISSSLADRWIATGTTRLTVRRAMHFFSSVGCAVCALPLCLFSTSMTPTSAALWLTAMQGLYATSFGGFHAYIQDVGGNSAGKLVGLTNTCSIAAGIAGNMATGALVQATGSYASVFLMTTTLYASSFIVFWLTLDGQPLQQHRQIVHAE